MKRFKSFGCSVVGVDIKPYQNELYDNMLFLENLDEALMQANEKSSFNNLEEN